MEESAYDYIAAELECPVCKDYMTPPIHLCVTGHSFCEMCYQELVVSTL